MATATIPASTLAAIFARAIQLEDADLPPEAARAILRFAFPLTDRERMHELAVKNQQGQLTREENEELNHYLSVGNLLALLHSKARKSLKNDPSGS